MKEKWEIFARKYDRVADAIRNLAKCDGKWIDYRASYTMIEAYASKDLILFPYDSDTFENFQESYQELEQLHNMLDFPEITMTVEVFLFFVIFEVNLNVQFLLFKEQHHKKHVYIRPFFISYLGLEMKKSKSSLHKRRNTKRSSWNASSNGDLKFKFERVDRTRSI